MSVRVYVGYFDDEHRALRATAHARERGFTVHDVYAPYAMHGVDRAMGLAPSRLTLACFLGGAGGLAFALWLQHFVSVVSWPLNVGGKPFESGAAWVPVGFELTVLAASLLSVAALFLRTRLFPGARRTALPRVTDDRFAVALAVTEAHFDAESARELLAKAGALELGFAEVAR